MNTSIDLFERLTAGARTVEQRAALVVLTALQFLATRADVVGRWYAPAAGTALVVDWHMVADDLQTGAVPMSRGERAALGVAASLAGVHPVRLADALGALDDSVLAAVLSALYVLGGDRAAGIQPERARFAGQEAR